MALRSETKFFSSIHVSCKQGGSPFVSLAILAAGFILIWIAYLFWGHSVVDNIYQSKSLPVLNRIIVGQAEHPLEYYTTKFDRLFKSTFAAAVPAVLFLWSIPYFLRRFSGLNKFVSNALLMVLSLAVTFLAAEGVARKVGLRPWDPHRGGHILIEPGGKLVRIDPLLGYSLIPGHFTATLKSGYTFTMTHDENGLRITHPIPSQSVDVKKKREIWIFGCSFTYGWSLNDPETYPWLLQQKFPEYEVVNFGAIGYGTLHAFLQFQEALKLRGRPAAAIYSYASFHDIRNTFSRGRRKAIGPSNELGPFGQPCARLDQSGNLIFSSAVMHYEELPFMRRSALVNFFDERVNAIQDNLLRSESVTQSLLEKFHSLALASNVPLTIAGIDRQGSVALNSLISKGIRTIDISVDLSQQANRNWPHDSHPSAAAHQQYAEKLESYLRKIL